MPEEYFKVKTIWQRFRKGFRQYPFSICEFVSVSPGVGETLVGGGFIPDGTSIHFERGIPLADDHDTPEFSLNNFIEPSFLYDDTLATGLKVTT